MLVFSAIVGTLLVLSLIVFGWGLWSKSSGPSDNMIRAFIGIVAMVASIALAATLSIVWLIFAVYQILRMAQGDMS